MVPEKADVNVLLKGNQEIHLMVLKIIIIICVRVCTHMYTCIHVFTCMWGQELVLGVQLLSALLSWARLGLMESGAH